MRCRKHTLDYFKVFKRKCFILNTKYYLTKFDPNSNEGVFLNYSQNSKAYIILNKHTIKIEESLNVTFDETPPSSKTSPLVDDDLDEEEAIKVTEKKNIENDIEDETLEVDEIVNIKESKNHLLENVIGNLNQRTLRSQAQNQSNFFCFMSTIEPKNMNEALKDESWIIAMQEELNQFITNDVWELVPHPKCTKIIETKWVYRNKLDENGIVSRNKARLLAQGYNQQEGINYDETYAPIAILESIRILLAYACALHIKLFQMDVKSAFRNGFINEVYVAQPPGFIDFEKPNHVYKLKKALYGLKQATKAWYNRLKPFLIKHAYNMGIVDNTLFIKKKGSNLIIIQIYINDIIFGSTCQQLCDDFVKIINDEFEMSMMGELNFFLRLQIKQMEEDIFFNHSEIFFDPHDDYASSDDDPLYSEDIDYVDASPPDSELVSLEEVKDFDTEDGEINTDILLTIKDDILREKLLNINLLIAKIKALKDNPTPSTDSVLKSPSLFPNSFLEETDTSYNSLPESEIFCFDMEEKSSGNPTSHSDLSLPDYEAFYCDNEPDLENFTIDVVEDIFDNPTRELYVHVPNVFPTHPSLYLDSDFALSDDSLGSDLVVSFPSGTRNKIFDPGIFIEV
ncbi:retrovirus-related pol polyprotein from transposon TNT 1-94 [Tanacetum coccineum]